jgi:protein-L-isoaspartate(D-aspartate) O-methyltransferase
MALQSNMTVDTFAALRLTMVDSQLRTFDVTDRAVIERFLAVERDKFVPPQLSDLAYSDMPLKIAPAKSGVSERRLLAPMVLARLLQAAAVKTGEHVLDVAPGTGYSTAILAGLTPNVVALESDPDLQASTKAALATSGLPVFGGPLNEGVASAAPFDVILINGAVEAHLDALFAQLRDGGRLLTILRSAIPANQHASRAVLFEKNSGEISRRGLFDAAAPLLDAFRAEPTFVF